MLALVLALAAFAAGCGGGDSDESSASGGTGAGATSLTIELDADGPGGKPADTAELECGTDDEDGACGLIADLPDDFGAPTPPDQACTELYGGPDVAELSGTLRGEELETKLPRADGCEVDRFDPLVPILQDLFPGYEPGSAIGA